MLLINTLAETNFNLPKFPKKDTNAANSLKANQLTMAEIAYPDDKEIIELIDNVLNVEENAIALTRTLDQNSVEESFKEYAIKQSKPSIRSLLGMLEPKLLEEKNINLTINSQQDELIEGIKGDLLKYIRQYFTDNQITLNYIIDNNVEFKKFAYTDKEKLQVLMEENDLVKKLIDKLKLKTDY